MKIASLKRLLLNRITSLGASWRLRPVLATITDESLVLDCGANVGDITARFAAHGATVHAFEPDPSAFAALQARFAGNPRITLHNAAVWTEDAELPLYFHRARDGEELELTVSSTLCSDKRNVDASQSVTVQAIDLARFIRDLGRKVSVLKMDIEGAELDVIDHLLEEGVQDRVELALVETHEGKVPGHRERLRHLRGKLKELGANNFELDWV